jgi:hypothetical protein
MVESMCLTPSIPWNGELGWTATTRTPPPYSFSRRDAPISVPDVPMPLKKWVTRPPLGLQNSAFAINAAPPAPLILHSNRSTYQYTHFM